MGAHNRLPRQRNDRLAAELRRQGRSIRWFCEQMGVSRFAFWRIETGDAGAPSHWYERAAGILGVPLEQITPEPKEEPAAA
jgi:hypothetical protein